MKKMVLFFCAALFLFSVPGIVLADKPVRIDVLYMNHGPLQATLQDLKTLFAHYGKKITVVWHDVDTQDGEQFMAQKGIRGHIPLVVWMDDKVKFQVDGKEIIFAGFPTGSGPQFFQGKWKIEDLKKTLNQLTNKPR
jgi:hypothetical protein